MSIRQRLLLWYLAIVLNLTLGLFALLGIGDLSAGEATPSWRLEWEKTLEAAKKDGKLVAGIPASAELRKMIEEVFKSRFPEIELEPFPGRGPANYLSHRSFYAH